MPNLLPPRHISTLPFSEVCDCLLLECATGGKGSFTPIGTKALAGGYALLSSRSADSLRCPPNLPGTSHSPRFCFIRRRALRGIAPSAPHRAVVVGERDSMIRAETGVSPPVACVDAALIRTQSVAHARYRLAAGRARVPDGPHTNPHTRYVQAGGAKNSAAPCTSRRSGKSGAPDDAPMNSEGARCR